MYECLTGSGSSENVCRKSCNSERLNARKQAGFTLIELLTVIATIGVLSILAMSGFSVYRHKAAYAVATSTYKSARNALEASISDTNNLPAAVAPAVTLNTAGPVTVARAKDVMIGMQLPKNLKMLVSYDPTCIDGTCIEAFLSARHCLGKEYLYWFRRGDGIESLVENIAGAGCP